MEDQYKGCRTNNNSRTRLDAYKHMSVNYCFVDEGVTLARVAVMS